MLDLERCSPSRNVACNTFYFDDLGFSDFLFFPAGPKKECLVESVAKRRKKTITLARQTGSSGEALITLHEHIARLGRGHVFSSYISVARDMLVHICALINSVPFASRC